MPGNVAYGLVDVMSSALLLTRPFSKPCRKMALGLWCEIFETIFNRPQYLSVEVSIGFASDLMKLWCVIFGSICYRPNRLTQCCNQFKSPGVEIRCVLHLHHNVAFTF